MVIWWGLLLHVSTSYPNLFFVITTLEKANHVVFRTRRHNRPWLSEKSSKRRTANPNRNDNLETCDEISDRILTPSSGDSFRKDAACGNGDAVELTARTERDPASSTLDQKAYGKSRLPRNRLWSNLLRPRVYVALMKKIWKLVRRLCIDMFYTFLNGKVWHDALCPVRHEVEAWDQSAERIQQQWPSRWC